jgi:general nucleoside transport system ATP-binding protein
MALELRDIHKHYGPVHANDGIDLTVEAGTLHGLLGENGAGKSTLMKVVSGFIEADSGEIVLDGQLLDLASPHQAIEAGIGMLHQDPLVFLPFTVVDNFLLGAPGPVRLDRDHGEAELQRVSADLGFSFDPDELARNLTVGERQQLEITRLIWLGARVLILDEPTTGISASQRIQLFATLRTLSEDGLIVIFVSHKLEEVEQLCDSVTVLRQGKVVGAADMPVRSELLVEMMFGKTFAESEKPEATLGDTVLDFSSCTINDGTTSIEGLDLAIGAGEVIGLAGLEGSGQRPFLRAAAGLLELDDGRLAVGDRDVTREGYREHLASGVHFIPAGRLEEGLIQGLTIAEHIALTEQSGFLIDWASADEIAETKIHDFFVKGTPQSTVESLSGGNQQRLLLSMAPPGLKLLLMEHPTRGLDVESADYIWQRLLERRNEGTAIVFSSADLDELLRYSDRIIVFFGGDVFNICNAADIDGEALGHLIGGRERV